MAEDMFLLWGSGSPPCWRVMIALEEKNLQGYQHKLLSFEKGEHKSKEVFDVNPRGQNQFKSQGNQLIPSDQAGFALVYQRMIEAPNAQQKMIDVLLYNFHTPEEERQEAALKKKNEAATTEFQLWEGYLQKTGPYMAGQNFSLADVAFFPTLALAFRLGLSQNKYPKLAEYHDFLKDRPSIKATWAQHWLENPPFKSPPLAIL
ncbi:glutathione S-transferase A-like isoform X2 [Alosa sapidissima]|uniref:glutathione S-transferase A-like isoform X2 n=1 Tax=Alosa sapidissima TaxID=34773 RepID=UPI001C086F13|nr:glutathione S-transferase A-like isoform X2 [Alosa sapidissima]